MQITSKSLNDQPSARLPKSASKSGPRETLINKYMSHCLGFLFIFVLVTEHTKYNCNAQLIFESSLKPSMNSLLCGDASFDYVTEICVSSLTSLL